MPLSLSLRTAEDWRSARTARRYMLQAHLTPGAATANTTLIGLGKLAANPDVYISRIRVHEFHTAAAVATPLGWKRTATVAAGTLMTAADIPKADTAAANATLEVRTGTGITGTKANQYILTHPGQTVAAPAATTGAGFVDDWTARDLSERIRLTASEGLTMEFMQAGSVATRIHLLLVWEEVS
jgi:hypothetical protein